MILKFASLIFVVQLALCTPNQNQYTEIEKLELEYLNTAIKYLEKYGYLEENKNGKHSVEIIAAAIKHMQTFLGLTETGYIDEATYEFMQRPRCGVPDVMNDSNKHRFAIVRAWNKRSLDYYIQNTGRHYEMTYATVSARLSEAMAKWTQYITMSVNEIQNKNADFIVKFATGIHGDGSPFDGRGGTLAHAFYPSVGNMHFDDDEEWNDRQTERDGTDFYSVAIHEFGHTMGLNHSNIKSAIMWPTYKLIKYDQDLSGDDIDGLMFLYP